MDILKIVEDAIANNSVKLNKGGNTTFLKIIKEPKSFFRSNPNVIKSANPNNKGETGYQREIYDSKDENIIWLDMELPIGQDYDGDRGKRVDLIGWNGEQYVVCELKYVKEHGTPKNPFDAILQVLAYYFMIKNNCKKLDYQNVFHSNAKGEFSWVDVASNCNLQIRAPKKYWEN